MSPTIHRESGYLFYFVSYDVAAGEPPHVHVGQGSQDPDTDAKIWRDPGSVASQGRGRRRTMQHMVRIGEERKEYLLGEWYDYQDRI